MLLQQDGGNHRPVDIQSDDLKAAKQEAAQAQESLKVKQSESVLIGPEYVMEKSLKVLKRKTFCVQLSLEKHQAERRKWLEEKLLLIGQAKEAEDKRNQDMRRFVEDRERFTRQQSQLVSQRSAPPVRTQCRTSVSYS